MYSVHCTVYSHRNVELVICSGAPEHQVVLSTSLLFTNRIVCTVNQWGGEGEDPPLEQKPYVVKYTPPPLKNSTLCSDTLPLGQGSLVYCASYRRL